MQIGTARGREKQTPQKIDCPRHVFLFGWQFSLSCRVHTDYSIRQKRSSAFTCGTDRLTCCHSPLSCFSHFLHPLRLAVRACQSLTESNTPCQRSAAWNNTRWEQNNYTAFISTYPSGQEYKAVMHWWKCKGLCWTTAQLLLSTYKWNNASPSMRILHRKLCMKFRTGFMGLLQVTFLSGPKLHIR